MNHNLIVSESIEIKATPVQVWHALITPDIIKEYLFGTETLTDWKIGSAVFFQGEYEGKAYRDKGIVLQNVENEVLSYTYWSGFSGMEDIPENYSVVTYTLAPTEHHTTVFTWSHKGYASDEAQEHSQKGMPAFLEHIKTIVELSTL